MVEYDIIYPDGEKMARERIGFQEMIYLIKENDQIPT